MLSESKLGIPCHKTLDPALVFLTEFRVKIGNTFILTKKTFIIDIVELRAKNST